MFKIEFDSQIKVFFKKVSPLFLVSVFKKFETKLSSLEYIKIVRLDWGFTGVAAGATCYKMTLWPPTHLPPKTRVFVDK